MYEFICEHIFPGCTHKEQGDTHDEVVERAMEHLHESHGHGRTAEDWKAKVINDAMIYLPR